MERRKQTTSSGNLDTDSSTTKPRQPRSSVLAKAKGQFTSELKEMFYAHGDPKHLAPDPVALDILEDILLEFLYDTCIHANRLTGSKSRLKVDDIRLVFRHDPVLLGRIEEIIQKEKHMATARKLADAGTDLTGLAQLASGNLDPALMNLGGSLNTNNHSGGGGSGGGGQEDGDDDFDRLMASLTGSTLANGDPSNSSLTTGNPVSMLFGGGIIGDLPDEDVDLDSQAAVGSSQKRKSLTSLPNHLRQSKKAKINDSTDLDDEEEDDEEEEEDDDDDDDDDDDNDHGDGDEDGIEAETTTNPPPPIDPALASILGHCNIIN